MHDELRSVARDLLGKCDRDTAPDQALLAGSGWLGLAVPAELDGAGATFAEVAVLLDEVGRAAAHGPFASMVSLGLGALDLVIPNPARDELIRATVAGAATPILVLSAEWDPALPSEPGFRLESTADGLRLYGSADFVLDAREADRLLTPARTEDGTLALVALEPGTSVTEQPVVDATRRPGRVEFDGVEVDPEALWHFADASAALRRLHDRAAVTITFDSLGLSAAMLDATVEYVRVREQFGRPIGSFQAVKHACADMLVQLTVARELARAAVRAHTTATPDATVAISMAKSYTTEAAVRIAGTAMQLHGGMGYTWESGIHRYLKRATLNRSLFGSPIAHRHHLAARYRPE
nr:acyl-CoA dehydrogenase family protein [Nocardia bovistercoris]